MEARDFLLNDEGDLNIANGDFLAGNSDDQHQWDIIVAHKGWYKEFPFVGVGIQYYLKSAGTQQELKKSIQLQLEADNYRVQEVQVGDLDKMEIYVNATRNV